MDQFGLGVSLVDLADLGNTALQNLAGLPLRVGHAGGFISLQGRDPGPTITRTVRMYSIMRDDLKRYVRIMTMDGLAKFGATTRVGGCNG